MPYNLVCKSNGCSVASAKTGHKFSKNTSRAKAKSQLRLLEALEHGWKPTRKSVKRKSVKRLKRRRQ